MRLDEVDGIHNYWRTVFELVAMYTNPDSPNLG